MKTTHSEIRKTHKFEKQHNHSTNGREDDKKQASEPGIAIQQNMSLE